MWRGGSDEETGVCLLARRTKNLKEQHVKVGGVTRRDALTCSNFEHPAATLAMSQRPVDDFEENEVLPGVFLTDFRAKPVTGASPQTVSTLSDPKNNVEVIKLDIKEIENSVFHLRRSNTELMEAAATEAEPGASLIENNPVAIFLLPLFPILLRFVLARRFPNPRLVSVYFRWASVNDITSVASWPGLCIWRS